MYNTYLFNLAIKRGGFVMKTYFWQINIILKMKMKTYVSGSWENIVFTEKFPVWLFSTV